MKINVNTTVNVLHITTNTGQRVVLRANTPTLKINENSRSVPVHFHDIEEIVGLPEALFDMTHGIVVSNITTDLEPFTKAGEYHIVMRRYVEQEQYEISLPYILYVQVTPIGNITQILVEPGNYKVRTCIGGVWSEWGEEYIYASKADIEEAKQWAAIGWVL